MTTKVMAIRRDDVCAVCRAALPSGSRAQWDSAMRTVTCLGCVTIASNATAAATEPPSNRLPNDVSSANPTRSIGRDTCQELRTASPDHSDGDQPSGLDVGLDENTPAPNDRSEYGSFPHEPCIESTTPELIATRDEAQGGLVVEVDPGVPGLSTQREFERRQAKREKRIEDRWGTGFRGKVIKRLSEDPQTTTAWAKGARGEERTAALLNKTLADKAHILHDRKVPKTRGNIDHLVIASSGVWIIDSKRYKGAVSRREVGNRSAREVRLYVGRRDQTKVVTGMRWQYDAVRRVVGPYVPVHTALMFIGAEWPVFAKPFRIDDVWIGRPEKIIKLVAEDGTISVDQMLDVYQTLGTSMPACK